MAKIASSITSWYRQVKKDLPWRDKGDPYENWVAEIMAQQTTLKVVVPRFKEFMEELPDVDALASCEEEQIRRLWAGLGYYARARNLKKGAAHIQANFGKGFPRTSEEWLKVPGCGPYTAAVIASICFGEKVASVDGNAVRVVCRLLGLTGDVWSSGGQEKIAQYLSEEITGADVPGDFNQGIMELGQELCRIKDPVCESCPVGEVCTAKAKGIQEQCPPPKPKKDKVDVKLAGIVAFDQRGMVALGVRTDGFLTHTTGFPLAGKKFNDKALREMFESIHTLSKVGSFKHTITNHRIAASVLVIHLFGGPPRDFEKKVSQLGVDNLEWFEPGEVAEMLSSSFDKKAWKLAQAQSGQLALGL